MSHDGRKAVRMAVGISVSLVAMVFAAGAGLASIAQQLTGDQNVPLGESLFAVDQQSRTLIRKEKIAPPLLKVEIIRKGEVLCESVETPTINTSKTFTEYSLSKSITGCPTVETGDLVKATWIFQNEVEISSR